MTCKAQLCKIIPYFYPTNCKNPYPSTMYRYNTIHRMCMCTILQIPFLSVQQQLSLALFMPKAPITVPLYNHLSILFYGTYTTIIFAHCTSMFHSANVRILHEALTKLFSMPTTTSQLYNKKPISQIRVYYKTGREKTFKPLNYLLSSTNLTCSNNLWTTKNLIFQLQILRFNKKRRRL